MTGVKNQTLEAILSEVEYARKKHPGNDHFITALVEQLGTLAKEHRERESYTAIYTAAARVAGMAIRIMEDGRPPVTKDDLDLAEQRAGNRGA